MVLEGDFLRGIYEASHQAVVALGYIQELLENMQEGKLEEDPRLLQLVDDSLEKSTGHLQNVTLFGERVVLVQNGHVEADDLIVNKKSKLSSKIELFFDDLFFV